MIMGIIVAFWILSSVMAVVFCHLSAAESVKFNRKTFQKHSECRPKNALEWLTGRNYLRWKKANVNTRSWYRLCIALCVMTIAELLFILTQVIIIRGNVLEFFSWLAKGKDGIMIFGALPSIVAVACYFASRTGFEGLKRFLSEAICPVFAVLVAVIYVALIPLLFVWRNSTF